MSSTPVQSRETLVDTERAPTLDRSLLRVQRDPAGARSDPERRGGEGTDVKDS